MIEYDVPVNDNRAIPLPRETLRAMNVGDSVLVDCTDPKNYNRARVSAYLYALEVGIKFKTRKVQGGIRVWRVA